MSMAIETEGLDIPRTCAKCEGALTEGVGYNLCPHCGYQLGKESKFQVVSINQDGYGDTPFRTRQWQCPSCEDWNYEAAGNRGGQAWHDCPSCGYSERSPSDYNRRQAPEGWDEQNQGVYDYDDWVPMDRQSKFKVVAMGEMQQPGGVGATQTTGPTDGEGLDHPDDHSDMTDAGKNSFEQNVALETWVNYAVDMLNRGKQNEEVKAQLAHDGCPEPEQVLQRAQEQPTQDPVGNDGAEDPFEVPFQADTTGQGMESVHNQPPVLASNWRTLVSADNGIFDIGGPTNPEEDIFDVEEPSGENQADLFDVEGTGKKTDNHVPEIEFKEKTPIADIKKVYKGSTIRIAGTSWKGILLDTWEDLWGEKVAKVALSDGGTVTVAATSIEPDSEKVEHPTTEIQSFIDGLPEIEPTRPSILARIANLRLARLAIRNTISKVGFSDQLKLESLDRAAEEQIGELADHLGHLNTEADKQYVRERPHYRESGKFNREKVTNEEFDMRTAEIAAIWVSELPDETRSDPEQTAYAAAHFASSQNGDVAKFVAAVQKVGWGNPGDGYAEGYADHPELYEYQGPPNRRDPEMAENERKRIEWEAIHGTPDEQRDEQITTGMNDPHYDPEAEAERRYFDRLPGGDMHGEVRGWNDYDEPEEPDWY